MRSSSSERSLRAESAPLIAVTGASGFVGRHLVRELVEHGLRVRILTRRDPVNSWWRDLSFEVVAGALDDTAALRRLVVGANAVVHLAGSIKARDTAAFMAVNRDGCRALAQAARDVAPTAHFLQISSLAARMPALSGYAVSKRAGEQAVLDVLGTRATVLRPPAVYGPGDRETLIFFQLAQRHRVWLLGSAAARTALIHVGDLVAAMRAFLSARPAGQVYALADTRPAGYQWQEIMAAAAQAVGNCSPVFSRMPRSALAAIALAGDGARRLGYANMLTSEKLRELLCEDWAISPQEQIAPGMALGWQPRIGLQAGFDETASWYRRAGWLPGRVVGEPAGEASKQNSRK